MIITAHFIFLKNIDKRLVHKEKWWNTR